MSRPWREGGRLGALLAVVGAVLATLAAAAYVVSRPAVPGEMRATVALAETLGTDGGAGFARVVAARPFAFPADHGPHPEYRTEWWYYTGNLETAEGRHFGVQLTFFRIALAPRPVPRASAWGTTQLYMGHLAVTDVAAGRFRALERLSRGALGLAGAQTNPFRVWLEDWAVEGQGPAALPMRLVAAESGLAIDLTLESGKAPVLHGRQGLSQKGPEPGNASYYYSLPRMPARGTIRVGGETWAVRGLAWMDREWGTSALGRDQVGWDWFALQLGDGRELMLYRLRRRDGSLDPQSAGTLIGADGSTQALGAEAVRVDVLDEWRSPRDGARYPARWRLRVPAEALDLEVTPYLADQELDVTVRYWEGAVRVEGRAGGSAVSGQGYVELTGYAEAPRAVRQ